MRSFSTVAVALAYLSATFVEAITLEKVYEMKQQLRQDRLRMHDEKTQILGVNGISNLASKKAEDILYNFTNLIDHDDPSKGTYSQRFYFDPKFYKSGGPLIFMTPGESNVEGYNSFLHSGLPAELASATGGAVFIVEQRYFGFSLPTPTLETADFVKYNNVNQSLSDFAYLMRNIKPPSLYNKTVTVQGAKWLTTGASWPGTASAWLRQTYPDLVFASHASSAPLEAIEDFWTYYEPIRQGMPKNCSADVQAVIAFVDETLESNDRNMIKKLKSAFGLGEVTFDDDFASAIAWPIQQWQDITSAWGINKAATSDFYDFCGYMSLKTVNNTVQLYALSEGWGLEYAFNRYSTYMQQLVKVTLNGTNLTQDGYYGTHCGQTEECGAASSADTKPPGDSRTWSWLTCTQFGWWQTGAPKGQPSIVSRLITAKYWQDQCKVTFNTDTYKAPDHPAINATNQRYGGWSVKPQDRLVYVNGQFDPWRSASSASEYGAPKRISSAESPEFLVSGGIHGFDLSGTQGERSSVATVAKEVIDTFVKWLSEA